VSSRRPLLSLERVRKGYRRGTREIHVLTEVSLELYAGELMVIVGSRHSGKTTLASVAAGVFAPDAGTASFDGVQLGPSRRLSRRSVPSDIGFVRGVGAHRVPDRRRVIDHVAGVSWKRNGRREAQRLGYRVLDELQMAGCAEDRWGWLSDRDRMLILLARALVRRPRLLVVDDLTVYLNGPSERDKVMRWLRQVTDEQGIAVLLTTDDVMAAMGTHAIGVLDDGALMSPETPDAPVIQFPVKRESA
jgi:putative ABC transport system ATP-binding protein